MQTLKLGFSSVSREDKIVGWFLIKMTIGWAGIPVATQQ